MQGILDIYPIGIDVDDQCLTAAQFNKSGKGRRLRKPYCRMLAATNADEEAALVSALKSVVSCGFFKGRRVAFNIPFRELSVVPVHFPLDERADAEDGILREAAKFLRYPLDEAIIDYPSIVRRAGNCDAIVVAVRRQVMDRWLGVLKGAGLTAEAIEFSISSLLRFHRNTIPSEGRADLLCHVGRRSTLFAVVDNESILSFSEISWGLESLWDKIRVNFNLPDRDMGAANLLNLYGLAYAERGNMPKSTDGGSAQKDMNMYRVIYQIVAPAVDELVYECHKTVSYLRSLHDHTAFGTVYLYGLANQVAYLDRYLETQVGIPVQGVSTLDRLDCSDAEPHSAAMKGVSLVPAIGLAMREVSWL